MKTRGLVLAAAVLALLAGALYWSNQREAAKAAAGGTADAPRMINLDSANITHINILRNHTEKIALAKLDSGDWQVQETPPLPGNAENISGVASSLSKLDSNRVVDAKPSNLANYGLAEPAIEAEIVTKDGTSRKLLLGDNTPTGSDAFAMMAGDPRLFTVSSSIKTSLDKAAPDFANKQLFGFGFDFPSKIELKIEEKSYEITYNGDDWKLGATKMDATSMQSVVARVRDLEGTRFVASGLGKPVIEITVTPAGGKPVEHAELSKSGNEYIGRSDNRPALYVVADTSIKDLEKYIGDMKVYVPPPSEPAASGAPNEPAAPIAPTK